MAIKRRRPSFDRKSFLVKVGAGPSIGKYRKDQVLFSQGDPADAVFYIQKGKVKITVVSEQGKEAVVAVLAADEFVGEGCLARQAQRIANVAAAARGAVDAAPSCSDPVQRLRHALTAAADFCS
jgi:CRP-like cAMP-binding protein